jgi:hypothetical protein
MQRGKNPVIHPTPVQNYIYNGLPNLYLVGESFLNDKEPRR